MERFGAERFKVLNPQAIAQHLRSSPERKKDILLRDKKTREVAKRLESWEIFLHSPITRRSTRLFITPEKNRVVAVVSNDKDFAALGPEFLMDDEPRIDSSDHATAGIEDITDILFHEGISNMVEFISDGQDYFYSLQITPQGRIFSNFRLKRELDDRYFIAMSDLD